jgi:mono/diheme cytochrome c family protein
MAAGAVLAMLVSAALLSCVTPPGGSMRAVERGKDLYSVSCAGCHGGNARGSGPVAPLLGAQVPDLTLIAARRNGVFPLTEIYRIVDGQADLPEHGPRHMPIWGYEFFGDSASDEAAHREASAKIDSVVAYLRSVQRVKEE